jgi:hypothetical protein
MDTILTQEQSSPAEHPETLGIHIAYVFGPGRSFQSSPSSGLGVGSRTAASPFGPCLCPPSLLLFVRVRGLDASDQRFRIYVNKLTTYLVPRWHVAGVDQLVGGDSAKCFGTLSNHGRQSMF